MEIDDSDKSRGVEDSETDENSEAGAKTPPVSVTRLVVEDEEEAPARVTRTLNAEMEAESELDDADDSRPYREPQERRRNFANARELMTDELRMRATQSSDRLRACLAGSILVKLKERGEKYLFDWSGATARAESTEQNEGDCVINMTESNLLKVAAGELNPQIGMLSDKIQVQGKLSLAVYFFNLIAPHPQQ